MCAAIRLGVGFFISVLSSYCGAIPTTLSNLWRWDSIEDDSVVRNGDHQAHDKFSFSKQDIFIQLRSFEDDLKRVLIDIDPGDEFEDEGIRNQVYQVVEHLFKGRVDLLRHAIDCNNFWQNEHHLAIKDKDLLEGLDRKKRYLLIQVTDDDDFLNATPNWSGYYACWDRFQEGASRRCNHFIVLRKRGLTVGTIVHQVAQLIEDLLAFTHPDFKADVRKAYSLAVKKQKLGESFLSEGAESYWAEGMRVFVNCMEQTERDVGAYIYDGELFLKEYDRSLYDLLKHYFDVSPLLLCEKKPLSYAQIAADSNWELNYAEELENGFWLNNSPEFQTERDWRAPSLFELACHKRNFTLVKAILESPKFRPQEVFDERAYAAFFQFLNTLDGVDKIIIVDRLLATNCLKRPLLMIARDNQDVAFLVQFLRKSFAEWSSIYSQAFFSALESELAHLFVPHAWDLALTHTGKLATCSFLEILILTQSMDLFYYMRDVKQMNLVEIANATGRTKIETILSGVDPVVAQEIRSFLYPSDSWNQWIASVSKFF